MTKLYKVIKETTLVIKILNALASEGLVEEFRGAEIVKVPKGNPPDFGDPEEKSYYDFPVMHDPLSSLIAPEPEEPKSPYLSTHLPIESVMSKICVDILGMDEDKKQWRKELQSAVAIHGHDSIIESFEQWCLAQGSILPKKPISSFLKNIGNNVNVVTRKVATSPALERVLEKITYISNSTVFFSGQYRLALAQVIKDFGEDLVVTAFSEFYQKLDDKRLDWAARDFLTQVELRIKAILLKKQQALRGQQLLEEAYKNAQNSVEEVEGEEEL